MTNGATPPTNNRDSQINNWWQEVEAAVRSAHPTRARRFLRWIVTCEPEEEEAWLALAHLATTPEERLQTLHRAYTFHPDSLRVVSRLSEARTEYLASSVGDLVRPHHLIRCLPDERHLPHSASMSRNGHHPHPLEAVGRKPGLLSKLLQVINSI